MKKKRNISETEEKREKTRVLNSLAKVPRKKVWENEREVDRERQLEREKKNYICYREHLKNLGDRKRTLTFSLFCDQRLRTRIRRPHFSQPLSANPPSVIVCYVFMFLSSEVFGIIFVWVFGHVKLKPEVEAKVEFDFLTLS